MPCLPHGTAVSVEAVPPGREFEELRGNVVFQHRPMKEAAVFDWNRAVIPRMGKKGRRSPAGNLFFVGEEGEQLGAGFVTEKIPS